ncbi:class I SAM-dependent methyltransferase [Bradyrhizobium sp. Ai1a-2]|uniref:class I SAM-dependent methyltransferase n=1 Tax=Bradyrhizobium sp. Ai1a-2 TaxID=196490 RepID=UPI00040B8504|nr:class I SAM-dependent methyltransferase [Bradyrhizobium sp. Ai1a-2]
MSATTTTATGSAPVQGELWGVRARDYAEVQEPTFLPLYRSALTRPEVAKASSILDVGCGTGLAAEVFSRAIGRVAGVDATAQFIEIARRRVAGGDFHVAEMEALPYEDHSFDVVTGFNSFQYAASPVNALREARRVVNTDGVIIIAVWGLPETCEAAGHLKALGSLMPPPPPGAPGPFALSDEAKLKALASEAGLKPGAVVDVDCPWIYPNLDTALSGLLSSGPAERAIRTSSIERARDAIAAAIAPYLAASGYRLNNTFRYLVARP